MSHTNDDVSVVKVALTLRERALAGYVASTLTGATSAAAALRRTLADLNTPDWLLDHVGVAAGRWSVSDDDRIDVIVAYAARLTRTPIEIEATDIDRLRGVGLTELDIVDLDNVIANHIHLDRAASARPEASSS